MLVDCHDIPVMDHSLRLLATCLGIASNRFQRPKALLLVARCGCLAILRTGIGIRMLAHGLQGMDHLHCHSTTGRVRWNTYFIIDFILLLRSFMIF